MRAGLEPGYEFLLKGSASQPQREQSESLNA